MFDVIPDDVLNLVGPILMVFGWVVKFWASYILGVASYYYAGNFNDLFL
jgi:hypothetical protein